MSLTWLPHEITHPSGRGFSVFLLASSLEEISLAPSLPHLRVRHGRGVEDTRAWCPDWNLSSCRLRDLPSLPFLIYKDNALPGVVGGGKTRCIRAPTHSRLSASSLVSLFSSEQSDIFVLYQHKSDLSCSMHKTLPIISHHTWNKSQPL